jgi:hypothetical protein
MRYSSRSKNSERTASSSRPGERALPEKSRLRQAVAGSLVLLAAVAGLSPRALAQEPGVLQASANGEYSTALSGLPESLRMEWIQQERLLLDSFEQQSLDAQAENRVSLRRLREEAAEERLQAHEEYREELRDLGERHAEELQRLAADVPPERYQRKRESLQDDYRDDAEDLRIDQARLLDEIREDHQEELDELASELDQLLFNLRTERQYALEQLKVDTIEALLGHYQRQLEMEALERIVFPLGVGPSGDQAASEVLDYLRDRVSVEAVRTDVGRSSIRITVTVRADVATIDDALKLFNLSGE